MFSTKSTRLASSLVGTVLRSSGSRCIILPRFRIRTENGGQLVAALRKSTVSLELSSYAIANAYVRDIMPGGGGGGPRLKHCKVSMRCIRCLLLK